MPGGREGTGAVVAVGLVGAKKEVYDMRPPWKKREVVGWWWLTGQRCGNVNGHGISELSDNRYSIRLDAYTYTITQRAPELGLPLTVS